MQKMLNRKDKQALVELKKLNEKAEYISNRLIKIQLTNCTWQQATQNHELPWEAQKALPSAYYKGSTYNDYAGVETGKVVAYQLDATGWHVQAVRVISENDVADTPHDGVLPIRGEVIPKLMQALGIAEPNAENVTAKTVECVRFTEPYADDYNPKIYWNSSIKKQRNNMLRLGFNETFVEEYVNALQTNYQGIMYPLYQFWEDNSIFLNLFGEPELTEENFQKYLADGKIFWQPQVRGSWKYDAVRYSNNETGEIKSILRRYTFNYVTNAALQQQLEVLYWHLNDYANALADGVIQKADYILEKDDPDENFGVKNTKIIESLSDLDVLVSDLDIYEGSIRKCMSYSDVFNATVESAEDDYEALQNEALGYDVEEDYDEVYVEEMEDDVY